jgi:outer membrane protein TolC
VTGASGVALWAMVHAAYAEVPEVRAEAPAPDVLALEDVLLAVDDAHPLLAAARMRERIAAGERVAADASLDPSLKAKVQAKPGTWDSRSVTLNVPVRAWGGDVTAGWSRGTGTFEAWQGELETDVSGEVSVGWSLPLLRDAWTDRRRATRERALREVDVAGAEVRMRALEVRRAAAGRYWDWVAAGARVRVAERLLALAEARDAAFAVQVDLGDVAAVVREDSRRLVLERTDRRILARRMLDQARIELSMHVRDADGRRVMPPDAVLPGRLEGPTGAVVPAEALATALRHRPELARLGAQREQFRVDSRLQSNQRLPALDVLGEHTRPGDASAPTWKVGAQAEWALGARAARGRLASAEAGVQRLEADMRFAADRIEADVLDALGAVEAARARISVTESLVSVARRVAEAESARFALGDSNLIFVNQREIAVAEAELQAIDAHLAACKGWIDLLAAQGLLGVSVASP